MAGTAVTTGVTPAFVQNDNTNQTAAIARGVARALAGGHGCGIMSGLAPSIDGGNVDVSAGVAIIPSAGFDGNASAHAVSTGYYVVRADSIVQNVAPATGTRTGDKIILQINTTGDEVAEVQIYGSGETPAYPYIQLGTVDVTSGSASNLVDTRWYASERNPQAYNTFWGNKGSGTTPTSVSNITDEFSSSFDPSGILDAGNSRINIRIAGEYDISISGIFTTASNEWSSLYLNKGSATYSTNLMLAATQTFSGGGTLSNAGASASGIFELAAGDQLRFWILGSLVSNAFENARLSIKYLRPLDSGNLPSGLTIA